MRNHLPEISRGCRVMLLLIPVILLTGCGQAKTAKQLIRDAKYRHGACEVISQSDTSKGSKALLRDKLQGFEYEVSSYMSDINIDNTSFGSIPSTSDNFEKKLKEYAVYSAKKDIDDICSDYGVSYNTDCYEIIMEVLVPDTVSDKDAAKAAVEIADVLQDYNLKERMDGFEIWVESEEGSEHLGSVRLPDCSFRDTETEAEDYYLEMAQTYNKNAVFVRKVRRTYADTGLSLDRAAHILGSDNIEKPSDPVTFYYYSVNGKEFFICNFVDNETNMHYTNYDEIF